MNYIGLLWNLYILKQNTKKSRTQIKKLQKKKLYRLLKFAYENSHYYHNIFEQNGIYEKNLLSTPLSQFPILDKEQLMANFDKLVTVSDLKQDELRKFDEQSSKEQKIYLNKYHVVHSSGSTGIPKYFVYDKSAWNQMLLGIIRGALWNMSMIQILRLLSDGLRILYIAATDGRYGGAMAVGDGIDNLHAEQLFLDINTPLPQWISKIQSFQPNIIIGYPSAIKILGNLLEQNELQIEVKRVISCGEPLNPVLRNYFENIFCTDIVNFYGASESLALGIETSNENSMYLFDDMNIVEVIDGEMYITALYNFVQPLIRYHITDKMVLHKANEYGFTCADVLLSREEDIIWFELQNGKREFLHPLSVEGFCVEGLIDYQLCQTGKDAFEMLAEVSDDALHKSVQSNILHKMNQILHQKNLDNVKFSIRFVNHVLPDKKTGKKRLIVKSEPKQYHYDKSELERGCICATDFTQW